MKYLLNWVRCRSGATAIEYGLIVGGISVAIIGAVYACGDSINGLYTVWSSYIGNLLKG